MDASKLRYPETVHSGAKQKFCILLPVEGWRNAPKHSQTSIGSNGVEWMLHNFDTPKQCIQARNISFQSCYLLMVSEMLRNTPKHHFVSNGDVSQPWNPEIVHSGSEQKFCILLHVEG
jgi:hypothetical protein